MGWGRAERGVGVGWGRAERGVGVNGVGQAGGARVYRGGRRERETTKGNHIQTQQADDD